MAVYGHKPADKVISSAQHLFINYTNGKSELIFFESFFNGKSVFNFTTYYKCIMIRNACQKKIVNYKIFVFCYSTFCSMK